jgi:hypothetical protein
MRAREIILEMSNAVRKDSSSPNTNRYFNIGSGNLGYILNQTGENSFYPSSDREQFDSVKELTDAIKNFEDKVHGKIIWTNPEALNNSRAFGVLKLRNENGQVVYVGKLLHSNRAMIDNNRHKHDPTDSNPNKFDTAALTKLGYVYGGSKSTLYDISKLRDLSNTALKTGNWSDYDAYLNNPTQQRTTKVSTQSYGFEPVDVLNPLTNLTVAEVVSQVEEKYQDTIPSLVAVTKLVASGKPGPYPLPDMPLNKFATQFCEILQPLAIASGGLLIEDYNTKNSLMTFNSSRSATGWDSKLVMPNGEVLNVSTKKEQGFPSSVTTFVKVIDELSDKEIRNFKNEIAILKSIMSATITPNKKDMGALQLAVDLNLITPRDAEYISRLHTKQNTRDYKATTGRDFEMPSDAPESVVNMINLGKKNSKYGLHPYYNALYYVMNSLVNTLNSNKKMKDLLKNLYAKSNSVLISTRMSKDSFMFVRKNADIRITAEPGYTPDWANKKLSFIVS